VNFKNKDDQAGQQLLDQVNHQYESHRRKIQASQRRQDAPDRQQQRVYHLPQYHLNRMVIRQNEAEQTMDDNDHTQHLGNSLNDN